MTNESILIGESPVIKKLKKEIPHLARQQQPILVKGDAGSGKALIARLIYEASGTKGALLVLNPSSSTDIEIKEALHRPNLEFSTVIFRNISDFSFLSQAQIDRFIRQIPKKPYVQIAVTTRYDLNELNRDKKIISELFETLQSFDELSVPSLEQRPGDIPLLVEYFIRNACEGTGINLKAIDVNALDFLCRREWKENVRELKAVIERAVLTSGDATIELPEYILDEYSQLNGILGNIKVKKAFSFDKSLFNLEKSLIERTLEAAGFNQSKAAEMLKLSEANLRYRLKKFHIPTYKDKR